MIIFESMIDVIRSYQKIGRPLSEEMAQSLAEVDYELNQAELPQTYAVIEIRCRVCNHEQICIVPVVADLDELECSNCGNMTAQEVDEKEWWQ